MRKCPAVKTLGKDNGGMLKLIEILKKLVEESKNYTKEKNENLLNYIELLGRKNKLHRFYKRLNKIKQRFNSIQNDLKFDKDIQMNYDEDTINDSD